MKIAKFNPREIYDVYDSLYNLATPLRQCYLLYMIQIIIIFHISYSWSFFHFSVRPVSFGFGSNPFFLLYFLGIVYTLNTIYKEKINIICYVNARDIFIPLVYEYSLLQTVNLTQKVI